MAKMRTSNRNSGHQVGQIMATWSMSRFLGDEASHNFQDRRLMIEEYRIYPPELAAYQHYSDSHIRVMYINILVQHGNPQIFTNVALQRGGCFAVSSCSAVKRQKQKIMFYMLLFVFLFHIIFQFHDVSVLFLLFNQGRLSVKQPNLEQISKENELNR